MIEPFEQNEEPHLFDVDTICYFFNSNYMCNQLIKLMKDRGYQSDRALELLGCFFAQGATKALESLHNGGCGDLVQPSYIDQESRHLLDLLEERFPAP
jgi:hypothetical protein